jgi:hypothetical protein
MPLPDYAALHPGYNDNNEEKEDQACKGMRARTGGDSHALPQVLFHSCRATLAPSVIAGLDPAISLGQAPCLTIGMPGTRPGMTE